MSVRIEEYVGRKVDFPRECELEAQSDGSIRIVKWDTSSLGKNQPSNDILTALGTQAANKVASNQRARTRINAYPTIGDQLDMLWHAIDDGNWTAAKLKNTDFGGLRGFGGKSRISSGSTSNL